MAGNGRDRGRAKMAGVVDELREDLRALREKNDALNERLIRLEERHTVVSKAAHDDRVAMRIRVEEIGNSVEKLEKSTEAVINQVKGGRAVIRALWWLGGIVAAAAAHLTGLLHYLLPFMPPPR